MDFTENVIYHSIYTYLDVTLVKPVVKSVSACYLSCMNIDCI